MGKKNATKGIRLLVCRCALQKFLSGECSGNTLHVARSPSAISFATFRTDESQRISLVHNSHPVKSVCSQLQCSKSDDVSLRRNHFLTNLFAMPLNVHGNPCRHQKLFKFCSALLRWLRQLFSSFFRLRFLSFGVFRSFDGWRNETGQARQQHSTVDSVETFVCSHRNGRMILPSVRFNGNFNLPTTVRVAEEVARAGVCAWCKHNVLIIYLLSD